MDRVQYMQQRNKIVTGLMWVCFILGLGSNFASQVSQKGIITYVIVVLSITIPLTVFTVMKKFTVHLHYFVAVGLGVNIFFMVSSSPKLSNYMMIYFALAVVMIYHHVGSIAISGLISLFLSNYFFINFNEQMFYGADRSILISLNVLTITTMLMFLAQAYLGSKQTAKMEQDHLELTEGKAQVEELLSKVRSSVGVLQSFSHAFKNNIDKTNQISSELTTAFSEISKGIESQASSVTEMNESMLESGEAVRAVLNSVQTLHKISLETEHTSNSGSKVVSDLQNEMNAVYGSVESTNSLMKELNDQTQQIGTILLKIREVTDQTNLLALNAAIEAARAGEAGKGFAVVAGEVRKLAETSQQSTHDIEAILEGIQKKTAQVTAQVQGGQLAVEKGLEMTQQTSQTFNSMLTSSKQGLQQAMEVEERLNSYNKNSDAVIEEISSLSSVSEQSSAAIEEVLASVEEQHNQINQIVESFKELEALTAQLSQLVEGNG